jgi:RimJ/RimL family protein N-acetyltransferase
LNGDPEVMRYIRPVKSREETNAFLNEVIEYSKNNPAYGRMAVNEKLSNVFVGSFAIIPLEKTEYMQLGYSLLPSYWGIGFATELVKYGLRYIFNKTNLTEIFGVTEVMNVNSQKVLLKTGFVFEKTYSEGSKQLNLYRRKSS